MPNWCWNNLSVSGSVDAMRRFYECFNLWPLYTSSWNTHEHSEIQRRDKAAEAYLPKDPFSNFLSKEKGVLDSIVAYMDASSYVNLRLTSSLINIATMGRAPQHICRELDRKILDANFCVICSEQDGFGTQKPFQSCFAEIEKNVQDYDGKYLFESNIETIDSEEFALTFSTRWSPAVSLARHLISAFKDLEICLYFSEPGCQIHGEVLPSGEVIDTTPSGSEWEEESEDDEDEDDEQDDEEEEEDEEEDEDEDNTTHLEGNGIERDRQHKRIRQ